MMPIPAAMMQTSIMCMLFQFGASFYGASYMIIVTVF